MLVQNQLLYSREWDNIFRKQICKKNTEKLTYDSMCIKLYSEHSATGCSRMYFIWVRLCTELPYPLSPMHVFSFPMKPQAWQSTSDNSYEQLVLFLFQTLHLLQSYSRFAGYPVLAQTKICQLAWYSR